MTYAPPMMGAPATTHSSSISFKDQVEAARRRASSGRADRPWGATYHRPAQPPRGDDWLGDVVEIEETEPERLLVATAPPAGSSAQPPQDARPLTDKERLLARIREHIRQREFSGMPVGQASYSSPSDLMEMPVINPEKVLDHVATYNTGITSSCDEAQARREPPRHPAFRKKMRSPPPSSVEARRFVGQVEGHNQGDKVAASKGQSAPPVITGVTKVDPPHVGIALPGPLRWWRFHMWDNGNVRPRNSPRYRVKLWADSRTNPNTRSPESESAAHPLGVWAFRRSILRADKRGALSSAQAAMAREWAEALCDSPREADWPQHHIGFLYCREPGIGLVFNYDQMCVVVWEPHDESEEGYRPQIHLVLDGVTTSAGIVRVLDGASNSPRWDGYYDPRFEERMAAKGKSQR